MVLRAGLLPTLLVFIAAATKCSEPGEDCSNTKCCTSPFKKCYRKDKFWASCRATCVAGEKYVLDKPPNDTPWLCEKIDIGGEASGLLLPPIPATAVVAPAAPQCTRGVTKGALGISGVAGPTYAAGGGGQVDDSGSALFLGHNSGYSILSACRSQYDRRSFVHFQLLGKKLIYTVDLSRVGCSCNLALYFVAQPAPLPGPEKDFYCDANGVGGQLCTEIDIMEANTHVFQATPHKCGRANGNCDKRGCSQNTKDLTNAYGPGSKFKIDTTKPFTVGTDFLTSGGSFVGMQTTLSQEDREVVLTHTRCDPAYLDELSDALAAGLALRITYWGKSPQTMAWLDEPPCRAVACEGSNAGTAVITGFALQMSTLTVPSVGNTPSPTSLPPTFVAATMTPTPAPPVFTSLEPYIPSPTPSMPPVEPGPISAAPVVPLSTAATPQPQPPVLSKKVKVVGLLIAIAVLTSTSLTFAFCGDARRYSGTPQHGYGPGLPLRDARSLPYPQDIGGAPAFAPGPAADSYFNTAGPFGEGSSQSLASGYPRY